MYKKYIAEGVGTFALSFVVLGAVSFSGELPISVPAIAALTLGLCVYTIGSLSGCHINPGVTLGLLSVKKITPQHAIRYIIAQGLGALAALLLVDAFALTGPVIDTSFDAMVFAAETLGMFFFAFGIASVVYGKAKEQMSGVVVGGSLLLGILIAVFAGSAGILNPAVAFALDAISIVYLGAPIVGAILAFQAYKYLVDGE